MSESSAPKKGAAAIVVAIFPIAYAFFHFHIFGVSMPGSVEVGPQLNIVKVEPTVEPKDDPELVKAYKDSIESLREAQNKRERRK